MLTPEPPLLPRRFLKWFCDEALLEEIDGDLHESFLKNRIRNGNTKAQLQYWLDVLQFFKPYSFEKYSPTKQYLPMVKNYLLISSRNIIKRKGFAAINILGLGLGLTAVMLVGLYIHHELTYDQQVPNAKNIYRLVNDYRDQTYTCMSFENFNSSDYETQVRLVNHLRNYEGVAEACHFVPNKSAIGPNVKWYVRANAKQFVLDDFLFTNTGVAFQRIFPQSFILGNSETAFSNFQTAILTESTAEFIFGDRWKEKNLLEQELEIGDERYLITGVVSNVPGNTHFDFGIILNQKQIPSWAGYTYFKTNGTADAPSIVATLNREIDQVYPGYKEDILNKGIREIPLGDIHFTEGMLYEIKTVANREYLKIFAMVGLVILVIIWTNYANLSIATYANRQMELGIRKVMGAQVADVALQILTEALMLTFICAPFIWCLLYLLLPYLNVLLEVAISLSLLSAPLSLMVFFGLLLLTGAISGLYPAFIFSKKPLLTLFKGRLNNSKNGRFFHLRRVLLTMQFFILIGLMSLAIIIHQQMTYIQQKSLGFNTEGVVYFDVDGAEKYNELQNILSTLPEIEAIGAGMVPGQDMYNQLTYKMQEGDEVFSDGTFIYTSVGSMEVYNIHSIVWQQLKSGIERVFVINETAAQKLANSLGAEPSDLIGRTLIMEPEDEHENGAGYPYVIADIIADFDYFNLKYEAQPMMIQVHNQKETWINNMIIRATTNEWVATIDKIEAAYMSVEKEQPFNLTFLDHHLEQLYEKERNAGKLASILTGICFILSLMGLVGIVGYITLGRQKEIGVRRVFGASVSDILGHMSKEYVVMMVAATLAALPAAIYLANQWLSNFAYRITPSVLVVVVSGLVTLLIVVGVVVTQSLKSARKNPADALRYE